MIETGPANGKAKAVDGKTKAVGKHSDRALYGGAGALIACMG